MFLAGLRVLDLSRILAGPIATQILADMGAEVLKVEGPSGDDTRSWGPPFQGEMSAYFQSCNRNKASLVLDFNRAEDYDRLLALMDKADVVVDNFPPAVRTKFCLDEAHMLARKSNLIRLGISGYAGARADDPGYDLMVQAESGLMGITGPADGEACKIGVALVDVMTGMMAANGILAALFRRERHGSGASLEITLFQTALFSLVNIASNHLVSGKPSKRFGNEHPNIVPYQGFQLADRAIILGVGNDGQFRRLCEVLAIDDPTILRLKNAERVMARDSLIPLLSERLRLWNSEALMTELKRAKIPHAPILRPDEALAKVQSFDPQALFAVTHEQLGQIPMINNPLLSEGMRKSHQAPPLLGEKGGAMAEQWRSAGSPKPS